MGALELVPGPVQLVYAGIDNRVYLSRDHGKVWTVIGTFTTRVASILVSGGTLYTYGSGVYTSPVPSP